MRRNRNLKAIGIISVITTLGVIASIGLASGQTTGTGGFNGLKEGYLNLHFPDDSSPATFNLFSTEPPSSATFLAGPQTILAGSKCSANLADTDPNLATVSAGLVSGGSLPVGAETSGQKFVGLGVKGRGSTGTNCGRVDPGETLTVTVNSGLVTAAELDIDAKGNAVVTADLYRGDTPVGQAFLKTSAPSGDSGPDATSGDNFAFPINGDILPCSSGEVVCGSFAPFTKMILSTAALPSGTPSFALEGGRPTDPRSTYAWDTYQLRATTADSVFKLQLADGTLDCGQTIQFNDTDSFARGLNNKDGSPCVAVAYDYNNSIDGSTKSVELLWDTVSQPNATFSLTQTWLPEDSTLFDGRPVPSKSTLVEWDQNIGFIKAPACTSPNLPSEFGTLSADITDTATSLTINLATAPPARSDAFNLQIGTEMISIPAQDPGSGTTVTYTDIKRHAGGTTAVSHSRGAKVMTTPFPIFVTDSGLIVARMCLSASSWVPTGAINPITGLPLVQVTETILAEGDMIGKH